MSTTLPKQLTVAADKYASFVNCVEWWTSMPPEIRNKLSHRVDDILYDLVTTVVFSTINESFEDLGIDLNAPGFNKAGEIGVFVILRDYDKHNEHFVPVIAV